MKIHQNSGFLSAMLKQVVSGHVIPASFQRPYVWEPADVLALCESIIERFPIGGFLTWFPSSDVDLSKVERRRLGPLEASSDGHARGLLLDGQNRLASLAWMLFDETMTLPADLSPSEQRTWGSGQRLIADLATRQIRFVDADEADKGLRLPMRTMVETHGAMALVRRRWDTLWAPYDEQVKDDGLRWWDRCADSFREARITETTLENASVDEAKRAFLHICRVGVPMTEADFNHALDWSVVKD